MKVLLSKNVDKLGKIGDVIDVANGYARNYLLPQQMAVEPTEANLKAVEADKAKYLEQLAEERSHLDGQAQALRGKEVSISVRANEEGHLYGSVGPAQIAAALAEERVFVEARYIVLDEPIRQLDKYDVTIRFAEDISATIHVWIVPTHSIDDDEADLSAMDETGESAEPSEGDEVEAPSPAADDPAEQG